MGIFVFLCMGSRWVCEALLSISSITANNGIPTTIIQKGGKKGIIKETWQSWNAPWSFQKPPPNKPVLSPIISGSCHAVSCFWTYPQQGPFPDSLVG